MAYQYPERAERFATRPAPRSRAREPMHELAYGLGWFSIALGVTEVVAPRALARWLGMPKSEPVLRAYGLREIAAGIGILSSRDPGPWVWGRAAGDGLDIATLCAGLDEDNPKRGNVGIAIAAVAGVTALDVVCAQSLSSEDHGPSREQLWDYGTRSGYSRPLEAVRGAAADFEVPADMRTPELLRPWTS